MALIDDINNLPEKPEESVSGHLNHHATIHESLKSHEARLNDTDDNVSNWSGLVMWALSMGRRNAKAISQSPSNSDISDVVSGINGQLDTKADKSEVSNLTALVLSAISIGKKNTKEIADLEGGIPDGGSGIPIPPGGIPGQLLMLTETGWAWTWADRHPETYHDEY